MLRILTVVVVVAAIALPGSRLRAATGTEPTAQKLLFDTAYLKPLAVPSRLTYHYSQKSADASLYGPSFEDAASVNVLASAAGDDTRDAKLSLFTGKRQRELGPLPSVSGNPVIMMFLEYEVSQMMRHVGGQPVYFRNVIRAAFRNAAKVEPVEITWKGKTVKAMKVRIQPFLNVPHSERLQLFRTKAYEFIASEAVPGGIYDIRSTVDDPREGRSGPAIDIHLTLKGIGHDKSTN